MRDLDFAGLGARQRQQLIDHPRQLFEFFQLTAQNAPILFG